MIHGVINYVVEDNCFCFLMLKIFYCQPELAEDGLTPAYLIRQAQADSF
jgi:hypothetical protein